MTMLSQQHPAMAHVVQRSRRRNPEPLWGLFRRGKKAKTLSIQHPTKPQTWVTGSLGPNVRVRAEVRTVSGKQKLTVWLAAQRSVLLIVAVLIVASAVVLAAVVIVTNHRFQGVQVGPPPTSHLEWSPAPEAGLSQGVPTPFGVNVTYNGSSTGPLGVHIIVDLPVFATNCSVLTLTETVPSSTLLTGSFIAGSPARCAYDATTQTPANVPAPQYFNWAFSVVYNTQGLFYWDVVGDELA